MDDVQNSVSYLGMGNEDKAYYILTVYVFCKITMSI